MFVGREPQGGAGTVVGAVGAAVRKGASTKRSGEAGHVRQILMRIRPAPPGNGWCAEHSSDVRPVAELQVAPDEGEGLIRIGDTPEELAQVVERSGVGACWDVGHSEWNNRRFGTNRHPTEQLWKRIVHVHCHDVDDEGDHRVLRRGDTHWRRFLQDLAGTDYAGTVVIEVAPETFLEVGGPQALEESIAAVTEAASN